MVQQVDMIVFRLRMRLLTSKLPKGVAYTNGCIPISTQLSRVGP